MSQNEQQPETPVLPSGVNYNREDVVDRKGGNSMLGWEDFGSFKIALRSCRFSVGEKKDKRYLAVGSIVASTNEDWPVGNEITFYFPVDRGGTATDPKKAARDDAHFVSFVRCVMKVRKGDKTADNNALIGRLIAMPEIDDDSILFGFKREPNPKKMVITDPTDPEKILKEYTKVFARDTFSIVT